ncbi:MAG: cartilage oligomeric matrix protein [Candidatus Gottesmanbacteria bacterium GW2011_GWA2_43_14]|uniref:Cartilage oligomeric matrix protein n=1 Tax=Candidatus Gottesmanbacteria bacterium GW2011_GWA2_43_14 TaxID=1618443 RepID=A0A0G1DK62_9BACT|nr:MAG: cartilage oligomeric matrix protein [Candidatus Gottesmanbacteria bacterium GW2011_GWA2_43_14]
MKKINIFLSLSAVIFFITFISVLPKKVNAQAGPDVCPSGLVSYWKGDDTAEDSVGPNNGQFVAQTASYATGKVNNAFNFDGGYFLSGSTNLPIGNSPRTLEFWVNGPNMALANSFLAGWGTSNGINYQMSSIFLGWSQYPSRQFAFWGFGADVIGNTLLDDNTWHHLAMTYDGTDGLNLKIYHNGILESYADRPHGAFTLSTPIGTDFIMAFNSFLESFGGGQRFHGLIDEVAVFNRALSESEVYQQFQNGVHGQSYCVVAVAIDIKPGSDPNCFNYNDHGVIPVAILGSSFFDATQVDPDTVLLNGQVVKAAGKSNKLLAHTEDVNTDGFDDLVVQIADSDGTYQTGDATATLTGKTLSGLDFQGTDSICIVP